MQETASKEKIRFEMVKERHTQTLQTALKQKKVDPQAIGLGLFLEKTKNYFTSSTCSGRIVLLKVNKQETKQDSAFIAKWHATTTIEKIWKALSEKTPGEIWFKQEPFILHIGCMDFENAKKLLAIAKECGIKRAGINSAKEGKFMLELIGTQNIAFPVKKGATILFEKKQLKYIVKRANEKLEKNYAQLEKFEKKCAEKLK